MNTRNLFQEIGLLAAIGFAAASCSKDDLTGNRGLNGNAVKFGIITSSSTDDSPETRALNVSAPVGDGEPFRTLHPRRKGNDTRRAGGQRN